MPSLDPVILFFILGVVAGLSRSDLRLPAPIHDFLSMVLLLAIGLKGGVALSQQPLGEVVPQVIAVGLMGGLMPLLAFPVLYRLGHLPRADAASVAAHYGSVSVGTYAVAAAFLAHHDVTFEDHMPVFVAVLEIPAIVVGILLARGLEKGTRWGRMAQEVFLGRGLVLLIGGLLIGLGAGPEGVAPIKPLFFDLFKGVLALFLLDMGLIAAGHLGDLRRHGVFLLGFGLVMPLVGATIGATLGSALGLSVGGVALLSTMAASASYIAVPAAFRMIVPEANPALSLGASLGVTFPFNILLGVPLYYQLALQVHAFMEAL
ncbi:sodium-dependent bicarbonate transport family permease [Pararhodospirillum oryzae]|uniref:Sodium-dependent bicarbonate transport family permease n=1 Tax=Pararhodospirillum oryzae TaxID=478448 RepID=A0A512H6S1_9PROT|nr:sodium-dependent bicarbonate transport family permease [Pararhodospirillum oryzae]GEO81147.1 sodium-dependent bicarbonate transport family permease [Pararhodospirillum oryzae]